MTKDSNCLNLVGDGDDIDVLRAIEEAFRIRISDQEAACCETFGQLFEVVSSKLDITEPRRLGCPTTLAFFRLRAALRRLGYMQRMTSETDLRAIFRSHGTIRLHLALARDTDLKLPHLQLHPASINVLIIVIVCGVPYRGSRRRLCSRRELRGLYASRSHR